MRIPISWPSALACFSRASAQNGGIFSFFSYPQLVHRVKRKTLVDQLCFGFSYEISRLSHRHSHGQSRSSGVPHRDLFRSASRSLFQLANSSPTWSPCSVLISLQRNFLTSNLSTPTFSSFICVTPRDPLMKSVVVFRDQMS